MKVRMIMFQNFLMTDHTSTVSYSHIAQVAYVSLVDHEFHEQVVSELQNSEISNKQPIYDTYGNDLEKKI